MKYSEGSVMDQVSLLINKDGYYFSYINMSLKLKLILIIIFSVDITDGISNISERWLKTLLKSTSLE